MMAARLGRRDLLRMLIAAGASFELADDTNGWTALVYALHSEAKAAHLTVSLLATAGADLNHPSADGATPLMHAVDVYLAGKEEEVAAFTALAHPLLHLGADVEAEDHEGKTAWMRACDRALDEETSVVERRKLARVRRVLEDAGARQIDVERVEILSAISEGQLGRLQNLLQSSTDEKILEELPLLSVAASSNNWDIVSFLVSLGLDINTPNRRGETILMKAAAAGYLPIVEQLLQVGADPSLVNQDGKTAESLASAAERYAVVAVLRAAAKGASPSKAGTDDDGS
jgi:ankyrin repeat protein